ncbi:MAG TPA: helix-turn-helix domain-containing protein [Ktedonobacteraceae bacterium]|nr:helix-turn-helix domain-containing protein [Ktedonobacteraceae bacterium]
MERKASVQKDVFSETAVQPLLLTIPQVMQCMGLGRNKVYDLIQKEGLPVLRFGRAVRVSYKALQEWLEQRERGSAVLQRIA